MEQTFDPRQNRGDLQKQKGGTSQYSTFLVSNRLYGIDVTRVQEVVRPMPMTPIPLAPDHVTGLINLRGQVATAIGMRQLFGLRNLPPESFMNVVCKIEGAMISLQVDEIGDVIEVSDQEFEVTPQTVSENISRFMSGIYKVRDSLLSIVDIDRINKFLNHKS